MGVRTAQGDGGFPNCTLVGGLDATTRNHLEMILFLHSDYLHLVVEAIKPKQSIHINR